jgi:hypothetical protein
MGENRENSAKSQSMDEKNRYCEARSNREQWLAQMQWRKCKFAMVNKMQFGI